MAQPVFKHQEDDGSLSIFASGNLVVFACENGHYWVLKTEQRSSDTVKSAMEEMVSPEQAQALVDAF